MEPERLASSYPVLYHMAEDGSWESVRRLGLLSTSALLDLYKIEGERRFSVESRYRPKIAAIEHPDLGTAYIRDQKPMPESVLRRCLEDMTPRQWYETLNRKVFFWVRRDRLKKFLKAYQDKPRLLLELDTAGLLGRYADWITLSSISSGAPFGRNPSPRGIKTFCRINDFPAGRKVAELTVDYAVPDIADLTIAVSRWRGDEKLEDVWRPPSGVGHATSPNRPAQGP